MIDLGRAVRWLPGLGLFVAVACGGSSSGDGSGGTNGTGAAGGGGSGGGGGSPGGNGGTSADGGDYLKCFDKDGKLTAYDLKTCTGNTCSILVHQIDCCGSKLFIGVESGHLAELQACEDAWRGTLPGCLCPEGPPTIEQPAGATVTDQAGAEVTCGNWTNTSGICITVPKK